jgi:ABC-type metal ion transport system substrate-binding protein
MILASNNNTIDNAYEIEANHNQKKGRIKTMGRMRENPRYNVISMRVSDEERDHLENLMKTTHKSVSDIMREAMEYFSAHYEQNDMNRKAA